LASTATAIAAAGVVIAQNISFFKPQLWNRAIQGRGRTPLRSRRHKPIACPTEHLLFFSRWSCFGQGEQPVERGGPAATFVANGLGRSLIRNNLPGFRVGSSFSKRALSARKIQIVPRDHSPLTRKDSKKVRQLADQGKLARRRPAGSRSTESGITFRRALGVGSTRRLRTGPL